jgi:hypothetical protein
MEALNTEQMLAISRLSAQIQDIIQQKSFTQDFSKISGMAYPTMEEATHRWQQGFIGVDRNYQDDFTRCVGDPNTDVSRTLWSEWIRRVERYKSGLLHRLTHALEVQAGRWVLQRRKLAAQYLDDAFGRLQANDQPIAQVRCCVFSAECGIV